MKVFILISVTLFMSLPGMIFCQDITTEGKDFWFGFMENHQTSEIKLEIYISARDSTGGVVSIPLADWSQEFSVNENATTLVTVPTDIAMAQGSGLVENKGIHIQTEDIVSVYALNSRRLSADATVVLPTPALGKTYYATSYKGFNPSRFSELMVVAVEDNTEVEVKPTQITTDGHNAGVAYTVSLDSGQVIQIQSNNDLTGTRIKAAGSCKAFAVFSGNEWTNVGNCGGAQDHLFEQMFPVGAWGKSFATVPFKTRLGGDEFKIIAASDQTIVEVEGEPPFVLNEGEFVSILLDAPTIITADKPIQIAQFSRSQSCDNQEGDPFMVQLSPIEQSLKKITYNAPNVTVLNRYYTNIITPTDAVADLLFDGLSIEGSFSVYNNYPEYSYAQLDISIGNHTIESASGFTAYVYGYGNIESFGYATGARLDNLNLIVSSYNETTGQFTGQVCRGDLVTFKVASKRSFAEFEWNFQGEIKTGNEVTYTFDEGGDYFITVTGLSTSSSGCSDQETSVKLIQVLQPDIDIKGPRSVCPFSPNVEYLADDDAIDNTREWFVEGGTIISGQTSKSIKVDWGDTNDLARVRLLTQNSIGCYGDTIDFPVKINIQLDPSAPFGLDSLCSSDITDVYYEAYPTPSSVYNWKMENGQITSPDGNYKMTASWSGPGISKLWYEESSTLDDVCSGVSDTLIVVIEREPEEVLSVLLEKNEFQVEEEIVFDFSGDENFNFISWKFGDQNGIDSILRQTPVSHYYTCPGIYNIDISAYTGTICQNTGLGVKEITITEPELEIISVSNHQGLDKALEVRGKSMYTDFYSKPILMEKRLIDPVVTSWSAFATLGEEAVLDQNLDTHESIFEYRLKTTTACNQEYVSIEHNNLLLTSEKDSIGILQISLDRNNYNNWQQGVLAYELWGSIDQGEFELIDEMSGNTIDIPYENKGFDHCFKVKAIEVLGNDASAWSNETCQSFVPEIKTYNVFSPNGDQKNQSFVIDGIENYSNSVFTVINRFGKTVFEKKAYQNDWVGTNNAGHALESGVYYYSIQLNEPRSNQDFMKGTVTILR